MEKLNLDDVDIYRVLSSMHEGVVISDITGKIKFFNNTQAIIDDINPEEVIGRKITDVYQLTNETSPTMRCLKNGKPIINETLMYQTRLGKVGNIISNVYPLYKSGRIVGAINFSKDYQFLEKNLVKDQGPSKRSKSSNSTQFLFSDIIGSDPDLRNAVRIAMMSSDSPSPIMIYGETGTGKEMFAQSIHNHSSRKKKPFIPVNCAAIPENLLEGILFGTSKGVFTGAIDKSGLFEQANGGTIFLDELDSMPVNLQAKLLRAIQEKKVRKLGSLKETELDVKIISSVGRPPLDIIQEGTLRMDLFYRMGVVFIMIPSLKDRKKDLSELISYFISKFNVLLNKDVNSMSEHVQELFHEYHWPGNVRELKHVIEASMNMVAEKKKIHIRHLPAHFISFTEKQTTSRKALETDNNKKEITYHELSLNLVDNQAANEKKMICDALENNKGNAAKTARYLGISPQSFHYKLKKHRINLKEYKH